MEKVRCADCGLLAFRNIQTGKLDEVDEQRRQLWHFRNCELSPDRNTMENNHWWEVRDDLPICSAMVKDLIEDIEGVTISFRGDISEARSQHERHIAKCIAKPRDCAKFCKWEPTFSPKEHKEMVSAESIKRIEDERKATDRKWRFIEIGVAAILGASFGIIGNWFKPSPQPVINIVVPEVKTPTAK